MRAAIVCLLLSAVAISADLQSDIEDVAAYLPMKEIESIGKEYVANDPEYAAGLRFVQESTYEQVVKDFLQTEEGQKFIEYFNQRGIDIESIWLNMSKMMDVMINKWLEPKEEGESVGPAISGDIMTDYRKALVESGFFDVVHSKMETSPEFANLVAAFKDPEFRSIFYHGANAKGLANSKSPEGRRGFWKKVWKATQAVAIGSAILG